MHILLVSLPFFMTLIIIYLRSVYKPAVIPVNQPVPADPAPAQPSHQKEKRLTKAKQHTPTHPLYAAAVKGFLSHVADYDVKEGHLAVCCTVSLT